MGKPHYSSILRLPCLSAFGRPRPEDCKLKSSPRYTATPSPKATEKERKEPFGGECGTSRNGHNLISLPYVPRDLRQTERGDSGDDKSHRGPGPRVCREFSAGSISVSSPLAVWGRVSPGWSSWGSCCSAGLGGGGCARSYKKVLMYVGFSWLGGWVEVISGIWC